MKPTFSEKSLRQLIREIDFDTGLDAKPRDDTDKAKLEEYVGSAPDIPSYRGSALQVGAKIKNVNYYLSVDGKIVKGDTALPVNKNALSVIQTFQNALNELVPLYTEGDGSGQLPNINVSLADWSVVGGGEKEKLRVYASRLDKTALPKVKTLYSEALKQTKGDKIRAAAICYEGARAIPHIIGISVFSAPGESGAYKKIRSIDTYETLGTIYVSDARIDPGQDNSLAYANQDYPIGFTFGKALVCLPKIVLNGDAAPDRDTILHELGHAIAFCFNEAFNRLLGNPSDKETDYVNQANVDVISAISPPSLPGKGFKDQDYSLATPQAKPYLEQAIDFVKKNTKLDSISHDSYAKTGFKILGILLNRDYSGVGSIEVDINGLLLDQNPSNTYSRIGIKNMKKSDKLVAAQNPWTFSVDEIRNAIRSIYQNHRAVKKELGDQYKNAADVRPLIAKKFKTIVDEDVASEDYTAVALLAALGPHKSNDFDRLNAVAKNDDSSFTPTVAESILRSLIRRHLIM